MDEEPMEIEPNISKTSNPNDHDVSAGVDDNVEIEHAGGDGKEGNIDGISAGASNANDAKNGPCNTNDCKSDDPTDTGISSSTGISNSSVESAIDSQTNYNANGDQKENAENVTTSDDLARPSTSATSSSSNTCAAELEIKNPVTCPEKDDTQSEISSENEVKNTENADENNSDDTVGLVIESENNLKIGSKSPSEELKNTQDDDKIESETGQGDPQPDVEAQKDSEAEDILESIDLELENEVDREEEGSDVGVQEIHDVEDDDDDEEGQAETADNEQETHITVPEQSNFSTHHEEVQVLTNRVSSLQSELEETKTKLARAEKKLNRSRRHKESAESYNYDLRKRVKHLKKELHRFRKAAKKTFAEVGCQTQTQPTTETEYDDVIEIPSMSTAGSSRQSRDWGAAEEHQSLADSLKATAEEALSNSGYVLDPNSGLYYDYSTGYYYDPNNHLYYDPNTGVYYFYDQRSRTYQFHSQVTVDPTGMLPHTCGRPRRGKRKKDRRQRRETWEDEEMECEVIEVLDDESPENKRPKKTRRKQKQKGSGVTAPHTATTCGDANKDAENQGSASKDTDNKASEKESDNPKSALSTQKRKTAQKRTSKKTPKRGSSDQKASESNKEDKEKDKTGNEEKDKMDKEEDNTGDKEKGKTGDKEKDKTGDKENDKIGEKEMGDKEKDKSVGESSKENQRTESQKETSDLEPTKEQEQGSMQKEGSPKELVKESTPKENSDPTTSERSASTQPTGGGNSGEDKTADSSKGETTPSISSVPDESKQDDSPSSSNQNRVEKDDDEEEIMEVESKRREEIEEITILDSDDDESEMEEGELTDSSAEITSSEESSECESDVIAEHTSVPKLDFPPCIRMIVTRSDKIQLGSLFIVTCTGGTIGREGNNHVVTIPELGVSKQHAEIKYNATLKQYSITDLGSQNGTLINGKLLSKARSVSEPHPLTHKDYLTVGSTTLRVHIHPGDETCDECEPGQVQALIAQLNPESNQVTYTLISQADKEQMRRKELRKLKKKYNLVRDNYVHCDPSTSNSTYIDRAGVRRKTVGSDNPYQPDDAPASVDRAISDTNVGRKMLEKMGWKEGKGLGKGDRGIKEPIQVLVHHKKTGLGAGVGLSMDQAQYLTGGHQAERWQRAQARFDQLQLQSGESSGNKPKAQLRWVSGGTEALESSRNMSELAENDADAQEDCIEILSPGSEDDPVENAKSPAMSTSNAVPTDTPSASSSTSTTEASSASASNPSNSSRPKIQLTLLPKRGKEQLPTSSVVLDDDDDDDIEAMEVTACSDNKEKDTSVSNVSSSRETRANARKSTRWEKDGGKGTSKMQTENTTDKPIVENSSNSTDNTAEVTESDKAHSTLQQAGAEETKSSSPKTKSAGNKWVKVGDGNKNTEEEKKKDEAGGDAKIQGNEAGTSEEGVSDTSQTEAQKESQSDAKGRRRRTRKSAKKKEDMFADL